MPRIVFADIHLNSLPLDMNVRRGVYGLHLAMDVVYIPIPREEHLLRRTGDYYIARADNRRILGLLERQDGRGGRPKDKRWEVRPYSSAFRGDHFDDEGDCLDEVPDHLGRWRRSDYSPLDVSTSRDEAAVYLLEYLYKHRAPAMGFGRHHEVRRHDSPLRDGKPITARTMTAGPYNTVEGRDQWDLPVYTVADGATPLRHDTPAKPQPKLTRPQEEILLRARLLDHGNVWSGRTRGNITSLRRLHKIGYIAEPEYGTRLTATGHEAARQLILKGA